jgi:hypothetical protein
MKLRRGQNWMVVDVATGLKKFPSSSWWFVSLRQNEMVIAKRHSGLTLTFERMLTVSMVWSFGLRQLNHLIISRASNLLKECRKWGPFILNVPNSTEALPCARIIWCLPRSVGYSVSDIHPDISDNRWNFRRSLPFWSLETSPAVDWRDDAAVWGIVQRHVIDCCRFWTSLLCDWNPNLFACTCHLDSSMTPAESLWFLLTVFAIGSALLKDISNLINSIGKGIHFRIMWFTLSTCAKHQVNDAGTDQPSLWVINALLVNFSRPLRVCSLNLRWERIQQLLVRVALSRG